MQALATLCKLNYTPEEPDASIGISKAPQVDNEFDLSTQRTFPLAREFLLVCTRPGEASSVRVAVQMKNLGFEAGLTFGSWFASLD